MLLKSICSIAVLLLLTLPIRLDAHAVLVKSSPAAGSTITGTFLPVSVTFNSKIDAARSKITLVGPGQSEQALAIRGGNAPNTLNAEADHLKPGPYRLEWQVLAIDGHITRGQIPFTVK